MTPGIPISGVCDQATADIAMPQFRLAGTAAKFLYLLIMGKREGMNTDPWTMFRGRGKYAKAKMAHTRARK
jgi:hypothetical protein